MNRPSQPQFDDFLKVWKKSPKSRLKPGMRRWVKKLQANPYLLQPGQLVALRAANFPLMETDAIWIDHYLELFAFTKEHGHALVPINPNRSPLTTWISEQRKNRRKGTLNSSRQLALHRLGFVWDANESIWKERMEALARFIRTHGHMRIPRKVPYWQLAGWVGNVRNRKEELTPKKLRELKQVGFIWAPFDEAWQNGLKELKKFIRQHGHANVPARRSERATAAGFLLLARKLYRKGKLTACRQKELEALGVTWNPMNDRWEERYRQLCEFHRKCGHLQMPINNPNYKKLKRWLRRQKGRPHSLSDEQKGRLKTLDASFFMKRHPGWHGVYHGTRTRRPRTAAISL